MIMTATRHAFLSTLVLTLLTPFLHAERPYIAWGQAFDRDDAAATQRSVGVVMDRSGNVIVTGYRNEGGGNDSWYTAKYDALTGALIWDDVYEAPVGDARPNAIAIDSDGNPVVTGYTNTTTGGHDFYTIKYSAGGNSGAGVRLWQRSYNNPQDGADEALALVVDADGNVIVTGRSQGSGTQADIQTFKYASANGADVWGAAGRRFSTPFVDEPRAIAVAPNGDVAVAGFSRVGDDRCYYTAKYAAANGALLWDETLDDIVGNDDDAATSVVMDAAGQVFVAGVARDPSTADYSFHTIAYRSAASANQILWQRTYSSPGGNALDQTPTGQNPENFSPYLGIDGNGDPILAGTSIVDGRTTVFYVAKYDSSANGAILWESQSAQPSTEVFTEHNVNALAVDPAGNAIVTGFTNFTTDAANTTDRAYYTVKFGGTDGAILWAERLDGARAAGSDEAYGVAADPSGNIAVVGTAKKPDPPQGSNNTFEILTVKYHRFLLVVGDPVAGGSLSEDAEISALNPAAVAGDGSIAVRVGIKDRSKRLAGIITQAGGGGATTLLALQGAAAPGGIPGTDGTYKSFLDPVSAPDGTVAFIAKLGGVPAAEAGGVWSNLFLGPGAEPERLLQMGKAVPGLTGVTLKKITSISLQNGSLAALITTSDRRTVFYRMSAADSGVALLQTGQDLEGSQVKKLSVYTPPKGSPGHGRYHGSTRLAALATLADKRTVFLNLSTSGVPLVLAATGGDAGIVASGAQWKAFGPAGVASNGFNFCTLATLQKGLGGIGASSDTAVFINSSSSTVLPAILAQEGATASVPGVADATFTGFSDPVSAPGSRYAFIATIKGTGVRSGNRSGIWWQASGVLGLVARTGDQVPDGAGALTDDTYKAFTNLALPTDGPLFVAKVSGKKNIGLWGTDSTGLQRQLLRKGTAVDAFGDFVVKKFVTLGSRPGAFSTSRSFNNSGGAVALVSFTNKVQAIMLLGLP
jgi:hypothetical protein